ncbi:hypothetical protein [Halarcobacter anaerophilus]|uniref:Uncharacterized protein n=1 Tax=Halarcobacter anaerophilus TaxID=877500 RepID=A0A4V1LPM1_9BACT|nr:hypothetical protein [Halarcobacter anaerophilus]QDF28409.1 hypothetical protein AANAER_0918 [Halarcobacter anaerophilus]RXJ61678.1 hypothetical protein CRV06_12780 [Halarcobacter anaerophilus]
MIIKQHLLEETNDYKKYNYFEITENLEEILADDYILYKSSDFKNDSVAEELYKKNFLDKYDRKKDKEIYSLYIDDKKFEEKVKFIYSVIDYKKYINFVAKNIEIRDPLEYTIKYSILDSEGSKIEIYHISIVDISFVF